MAFVPMALDVYGTIGPSTRRALQSFAQVIAVKRGTNVHDELNDIIIRCVLAPSNDRCCYQQTPYDSVDLPDVLLDVCLS